MCVCVCVQESLEEMVRVAQEEVLRVGEESGRLQQALQDREARVKEKEAEITDLLKAVDTLRSKVGGAVLQWVELFYSGRGYTAAPLTAAVWAMCVSEHHPHQLHTSPLPSPPLTLLTTSTSTADAQPSHSTSACW